MKTILIAALLLAACGNNKSKPTADPVKPATDTLKPQTKSNPVDSITGTPIKMGSIEIAAVDLPHLMIWDEAVSACENLGKGWRLPTLPEMKDMYRIKDSLGVFTSDPYWTSTEADAQNAQTKNFYSGHEGKFSKIYSGRVRAVRNL